MQRKLVLAGFTLSVLFCWVGWLSAQSTSGWTPTTTNNNSHAAAPSPSKSSGTSSGSTAAIPYPKALPVNSTTQTSPTSTPASDGSDNETLAASDFLISGVPYAKVLYMEGNVWIRPPGELSFHLLTDDEPIAQDSVIYTGITGVLDFATGPGMAVRMVPETLIHVTILPQPPAPAAKTSSPTTAQVALRQGTVFSALGREDGQPIDFEVKTPEGVAGARGTMFATSASAGQAEVNMLHGTVNFETPDHQTSQITAGQSQQISGSLLGKYRFGLHSALNPARTSGFFDHAGGLLEHASGYGVVRRGLGPDVDRTLHERGFALPTATRQRFQNAAKTHYEHRPAFNRTRTTGAGAGGKPGTNPGATHPAAAPGAAEHRLTPQEQQREKERQEVNRRFQNDNSWNNGRGGKGGGF